MSVVIENSLNIALVQHDIQWLDVAANLTALDNILRDLTQVDLVLLSETFATGFAINLDTAERDNGEIFRWMKNKAKVLNAVVAGSVLVTFNDKKVNRFYWCFPDGHSDYYDKRHLFRLGNEADHVIAGNQRKIFNIKGFRCIPQVCYDLRFPVFQRNLNDYDVLINVANWPAARRRIWDTLLQARAIENQCYVLATNRIGIDGNGIEHNGGTAAYDYIGQPIAKAEDELQQLIYVTLNKSELTKFRTSFPAYLDADNFDLNI